MKSVRFFLFLTLILLYLVSESQPANDNCPEAVVLVQTSNCAPVSGTTIDATQSIPALTCQGLEGYADDDVWYVFTATTHSPFITVYPATGFDAVVDLRSSPCNGETIDCSDSKGPGGNESIYTYGLLIGVSYYIRIYSYGYGASTQGNFTVCVYGSAPPPPVNDNCTGAISLLELPFCDPYPGTTISASQSDDPVLCNGTTGFADDDVWYVFTATTSNPTVTVEATPLFDPVIDLRLGPCDGSTIFCADEGGPGSAENLYAAGLTIGESYHVRIYSFGSDPNSPEEFTVCVHETFCKSCPDFDFEITPGADWQIHHSSAGSLGCNIYQFDASAGAEYTFKTGCGDGATAGFDTFLQLYDANCDSLASDDNTCEDHLSRMTWIAPYDGPAYLKIRGANADDFGSYSLAYKITSPVAIPGADGGTPLADLIRVFPNPAKEEFRIEAGQLEFEKIDLFDYKGVLTMKVNTGSPVHSYLLGNLILEPGLYILSVGTDQGIIHKKLEIQNRW